MKFLVAFVVLISCVEWSVQSNYCEVGVGLSSEKSTWQDMEDNCYKSVVDQIHRELNASMTYLSMGAHFTTDRHYRPGVATFFLEGANEERSHAKALMDYILMRGLSVKSSAIPPLIPKLRWDSIEQALSVAMDIERSVRQNFVDIIRVCEGSDNVRPTANNDYHASDLLTGVFLEEQHQSIRKIAGHLATLVKMKTTYGEFAEIMFDKTLLQ
ncbi:ferritin subunit [Folsomia candida]|uniref:Ferritin n=1 Tax=Folsomia candida TaxID=158441 RepID=A0A226DL56_FOLCA|nr:ferritin subunit [Folsomia candida]XP_021961049.1 ferritin subunit [Folsomia candida]XP_021961050.1 ferritin subunit [Folsomia candida]XP_035713193.1 ferritin subunit [Folsomia candida]XP_035713194.1 ferritin subunit [Folsomia candida]XP_035713195.1 ferritin subunit [Folsomia candida]XP_035713196.1 ferritin subunit [Folsomia candida]OXA45728.1 Ferritin subunit [Folsomia candida]